MTSSSAACAVPAEPTAAGVSCSCAPAGNKTARGSKPSKTPAVAKARVRGPPSGVHERLNFLFQASMVTCRWDVSLARRLQRELRETARKHVVRLTPEFKGWACKTCATPLIASVTASLVFVDNAQEGNASKPRNRQPDASHALPVEDTRFSQVEARSNAGAAGNCGPRAIKAARVLPPLCEPAPSEIPRCLPGAAARGGADVFLENVDQAPLGGERGNTPQTFFISRNAKGRRRQKLQKREAAGQGANGPVAKRGTPEMSPDVVGYLVCSTCQRARRIPDFARWQSDDA
eukprot:GHVT01033204.1.p1 GENE.GHVT01033204.1~~GHVT01033204.1.p1  ORF type:complete len:290 (+),score=52.16 GHVT01033204.1:593-1462(+)